MGDLSSSFEMEPRLIRILQSCRDIKDLKQTHLQILVNGLAESSHLLPKLMDLSSASNSLNYTIQIFEAAESPNVFAHNMMIKCFAENRRQDEAFGAYSRMRLLGFSPNSFTFTFLLKGRESQLSLSCCEVVHSQLMKYGFGSHLFVQNVLLSAYSRCISSLDFARQLFDEMPERDVVSWNSILCAYLTREDIEQAIQLFDSMPVRNIVSWNSIISALSKSGDMASARSMFDSMVTRNTITWNAMVAGYVADGDIDSARLIFDQNWDKDAISWTAMISGYARVGNMESARNLFDEMPQKNVVSWNAMVSGYVKNSQFDEALVLFHSLLVDRKCSPDEATLVSVVSACTHLGSLGHGRWIHSYIKKNNIDLTVTLGNALIDMFAKCGDLMNSELIFNQMENRPIITWTTMISGLALNGKCSEALALFRKFCMEGLEPDDVIFISALSACIHGGHVEEGQRIFSQMDDYGIKPRMEHYGCMVDLLGRAGKLEEAVVLIQKMPIQPNVVIWATLLSSCYVHRAEGLVEYLSQNFENLESLEPDYQVLISNYSARGGVWNGVMGVRSTMQSKGIKKVPGCSLIQVDTEVHEFLVKDIKHKRRKDIYQTLDGLTEVMRQVEAFDESYQLVPFS
ncbi:Pentatricopeptide repeat-containing protein [Apostasia shenzhenica]|uniref:Pentatricopeptide repeat-containing protein n=1 Tax=Apostasia shenzhenica TaxID=1088818 RepID=A0A2I0AMG2_9ASPA|nr:Pentatricopeptide repeat-containing protein [Apostasia shenzhenica]